MIFPIRDAPESALIDGRPMVSIAFYSIQASRAGMSLIAVTIELVACNGECSCLRGRNP
jgi:hypothetical protein